MKRLGRKYLVVPAAGAAGAALAVAGAAAELWLLATAGLAFALVCVFVALAWLRLDVLRLRSVSRPGGAAAGTPASGTSKSSSGASGASSTSTDQVVRQRAVAAQIEDAHDRVVGRLADRLAAQTRETLAQSAALTQLLHRYPDAAHATVRFHDSRATPAQALDLADLVQRESPQRVLAVDLGSAALWLGHAVSGHGGSVTVVEPGTDASDALTRAVHEHGLADTVLLCPAEMAVPDVPHAYLPWHDLASAGADVAYDLVVVGVPPAPGDRAVLPVLPLVRQRLAPTGVIAVVEPSADRTVARTWESATGWPLGTAGTALGILRAPA